MSIEKLKDGTGYRVRWRDSAGKSRRQKVTLYRDALTLDGEMKRKKVMGELIAHERGTIRLEDFWRIWITRYGTGHITARTASTYMQLWRKHIHPDIGAFKLRDIRRENVDHLVGGLDLAPASKRKVLALLHNVMQRAVEWEYLATNPVAGVRKPKLVKQRQSRALTWVQVEHLRQELDLRSSTIVAVLAGSGIRPGELRGLHWHQVQGDRLLIVQAVSRDVLAPTKTNGKRVVEMLPSARRALRQWQLASKDGLVFPAPRTGGIWSDAGWKMWQRNTFTEAASRAGLAGLVPYDLRHTWVSQQIADGKDILQIAAQAGHSPMMTLTTYGHLMGGRGSSTQLAATSGSLEAG